MYKKEEFEFIDKLLELSLNNDLTYTNMTMKYNLSFDLYNKLFTDINKDPYKLIELYDHTFQITPLGRKVSKNGFEQYLNDLDNEKQTDDKIKFLTLDDLEKSENRSKRAFRTSVIAIIVAILMPLMIYIITKPEIVNDSKNNTENSDVLTDSLPNH